MNRDEIIKIAQACGWVIHEDMPYMDVQAVQDALIERLIHFAHLVAEYERESCAQLCESQDPYVYSERTANACAAAIRARGTQ